MVSVDGSSDRVMKAYFDISYRLLTDSPEGRRFLEGAAPLPEVITHGYATTDDLEALVRALDPRRPGHLMDLGCGVGGMAVAVHRLTGTRVTGIDVSARAIAAATARASAAGVDEWIAFLHGSFRRPPRVGADAAYALDSLMFARVSPGLLRGIRDALHGRARLFATTLATGSSSRDPILEAAEAMGGRPVSSEDVTSALVQQSQHRRRLARDLLRRGPRTVRGQLAILLVIVEEALTTSLARRGRLRRWRTVVDLRGGA